VSWRRQALTNSTPTLNENTRMSLSVCLSVSVSLSVCLCLYLSVSLSVFVFLCVMPRYLAADCVPVSKMAQRRHLRSAADHQLVVPSELMWPSGILCTWSETVELFA